jgi:hypothetical protein
MAEAEVDQNLVQQLEQNLASFEAAGLTEDADAVRAKLAEVKGEKKSAAKDSDEKGSAKGSKS